MQKMLILELTEISAALHLTVILTRISLHTEISEKNCFQVRQVLMILTIKIDTLKGSINFSRLNPEFNLNASVGRLNLKKSRIYQR